MKLVLYPDRSLRTVSEEYTPGSLESLETTLKDMRELCESTNAAALAGIQVGIPYRIAALNLKGKDKEGYPTELINPVILEASDEVDMQEGCMSILNVTEKVKRYREVVIEYLDASLTKKKAVFTDFLAQVIQHEVDHMNGKLYIDSLSQQKREMLLKKYKKQMSKYGIKNTWEGYI